MSRDLLIQLRDALALSSAYVANATDQCQRELIELGRDPEASDVMLGHQRNMNAVEAALRVTQLAIEERT